MRFHRLTRNFFYLIVCIFSCKKTWINIFLEIRKHDFAMNWQLFFITSNNIFKFVFYMISLLYIFLQRCCKNADDDKREKDWKQSFCFYWLFFSDFQSSADLDQKVWVSSNGQISELFWHGMHDLGGSRGRYPNNQTFNIFTYQKTKIFLKPNISLEDSGAKQKNIFFDNNYFFQSCYPNVFTIFLFLLKFCKKLVSWLK